MSGFLDDQMDCAIKDAQASGWSQDGQIYFVRRRMDAAYDMVRKQIEDVEGMRLETLLDKLAAVRVGGDY